MRLSDREMEVYRRLVLGEPLTEIAASLCVSAKTISTYKMRLMDKLQLSSEAALVRTPFVIACSLTTTPCSRSAPRLGLPC